MNEGSAERMRIAEMWWGQGGGLGYMCRAGAMLLRLMCYRFKLWVKPCWTGYVSLGLCNAALHAVRAVHWTPRGSLVDLNGQSVLGICGQETPMQAICRKTGCAQLPRVAREKGTQK